MNNKFFSEAYWKEVLVIYGKYFWLSSGLWKSILIKNNQMHGKSTGQEDGGLVRQGQLQILEGWSHVSTGSGEARTETKQVDSQSLSGMLS